MPKAQMHADSGNLGTGGGSGRSQISIPDLLHVLIQVSARTIFPPDRLRSIVVPRGKGAEKYLKAYNLCDGSRAIREIAREVGIDHSNFHKVTLRWIGAGVAFRVGEEGKLLHLYPLPNGSEELARVDEVAS